MGKKVRRLYGVPLKSPIEMKPRPPGSFRKMSEEEYDNACTNLDRKIEDANARLLANAKFRQVLAAIVGLQRGGPYQPPVETGLLQQVLLGIACLDKHGKGVPRKDWEKYWTRDTDKSWKELTALPGRLRRIAEEVEQVGQNKYFNRLARKLQTKSSPLPETLRAYADCFDGHIRALPAKTAFFYPQQRHDCPLWVLELSEVVKIITGHYCDQQVVDLVNVAATALDKFKVFPSGAASALTQARCRWKRRTRRT